MFGEKDLIFLGAALLAARDPAGVESAIVYSVKLYEKIFGRVSDDKLRDKYTENNGRD